MLLPVFAVVTTSGSLVIYNMHITWKAIIKIAAHAGDATCLDWHPTLPYTVATGGAGDRCVKGRILVCRLGPKIYSVSNQ